MSLSRLLFCTFTIGLMIVGTDSAYTQTFPNRPVRIVSSAPGGGSDFTARLIARGISGALGQPVIVDNRAGQIAMGEVVAKASPDGYTMLQASNTMWLGPLLEKTPYDVWKDFAPVVMTDRSAAIMVVHPSLPVPIKSVQEFIALAKARPGQLNYGSSAPGTPAHLAVELFSVMAGINIVRVPYKGSGPVNIALLGGEVQVVINVASALAPHIKSGRLRALAVTTLQPYKLFPDLPTMAASGVPGYEFLAFGMVIAPAKTPAAIISQLNREIVRFLRTTEAKEALLRQGAEAYGSAPEELWDKLKSEEIKWGKLIKDLGLTVD